MRSAPSLLRTTAFATESPARLSERVISSHRRLLGFLQRDRVQLLPGVALDGLRLRKGDMLRAALLLAMLLLLLGEGCSKALDSALTTPATNRNNRTTSASSRAEAQGRYPPRGTRLIIARDGAPLAADPQGSEAGLFVVALDGSAEKRPISGSVGSPEVSRGGRRVAYTGPDESGSQRDVGVADTDGSNPRRLTDDTAEEVSLLVARRGKNCLLVPIATGDKRHQFTPHGPYHR
jgi:hypothetical protein